MTLPISPSLEQLIRQRMATGRYASEDALLSEALQALEFADEELLAIQEGLDSVDRGEPGIPLDEAFHKLRAKYQIGETT